MLIARTENKSPAPEVDQGFHLADLFDIVILTVADIELESELFGFLFQPALLGKEEGVVEGRQDGSDAPGCLPAQCSRVPHPVGQRTATGEPRGHD